MNDRFKFRVWDKYIQSYIKENLGEEYVWIEDDGQLGAGIDDSCILEQCTGMKDKNGNLIYEGDIVYDSVYENNFIVSWDNDRTGYILSANNTNHIDYLSKLLIERHNLEITGNIHENKGE